MHLKLEKNLAQRIGNAFLKKKKYTICFAERTFIDEIYL